VEVQLEWTLGGEMELEIAGKTNQKDHFDIKKRANTASLHHQTQPNEKKHHF
jgi:hypothetical protein